MSELIWLNGQITPLSEARIPVEERGYQFADGVYEVVRFYQGRCFTLREHLDRLAASADALRIALPLPRPALADAMANLVTQSGLAHGMIYLQLTRGIAPRSHPFPKAPQPTLLFYTRQLPPVAPPEQASAAKVITLPDERWLRCSIKTIALLPNILAKQAAIEAGADEAVFLHNGVLTECCSSNFFIVSKGEVVTHPVGPKVLPGVTRMVLQQLCQQLAISFVQRPVALAEARVAEEVFITSTTRELSWVSHFDGQAIATSVGPVTRQLHIAYQKQVAASLMNC